MTMVASQGQENAVSSYYDADAQRGVRDFVNGNLRVQAAIARCCSYIRPGVRKILDVGCGIGESTAAFRRYRSTVEAHGVDLSPKRVELATRLFVDSGVRFSVSDMTTPPDGGPYDLITMLDVYEHIPAAERPTFHRTLGQS